MLKIPKTFKNLRNVLLHLLATLKEVSILVNTAEPLTSVVNGMPYPDCPFGQANAGKAGSFKLKEAKLVRN